MTDRETIAALLRRIDDLERQLAEASKKQPNAGKPLGRMRRRIPLPPIGEMRK